MPLLPYAFREKEKGLCLIQEGASAWLLCWGRRLCFSSMRSSSHFFSSPSPILPPRHSPASARHLSPPLQIQYYLQYYPCPEANKSLPAGLLVGGRMREGGPNKLGGANIQAVNSKMHKRRANLMASCPHSTRAATRLACSSARYNILLSNVPPQEVLRCNVTKRAAARTQSSIC